MKLPLEYRQSELTLSARTYQRRDGERSLADALWLAARQAAIVLLFLAILFAGSVVNIDARSRPALALSLYSMCTDGTRSLWEVEANGSGLVDVATEPTFARHRIVHVASGDTFFWTRSTIAYIRQHGSPVVVSGAASDPC